MFRPQHQGHAAVSVAYYRRVNEFDNWDGINLTSEASFVYFPTLMGSLEIDRYICRNDLVSCRLDAMHRNLQVAPNHS